MTSRGLLIGMINNKLIKHKKEFLHVMVFLYIKHSVVCIVHKTQCGFTLFIKPSVVFHCT